MAMANKAAKKGSAEMATHMVSPTASAIPGLSMISGGRSTATPYGLPLSESCLSCKLRNQSFFCALAPKAVADLEHIKHANSFPSGAIVFLEGQSPRGVYVLCQGKAKLTTTNAEGKTMILKIAQPGEVLGLHATISGKAYELTVETLQPSQLTFIGREDFLRFIRQHGDVCLQAAQHLSRDCQSAYEVVRSIGLSHSAPSKLAKLLVNWAAETKSSNGVAQIRVTLTHEEIAQLIGSSRETVTRALSSLRKQGVLQLKGSTLTIRNLGALEHLASQ
jgi:CRP/FNR family transcriptional regulator, cyclic AMP receptor protein